jgi:hypothetical protein
MHLSVDRADGLIPHIARARQRFRAHLHPDPLRNSGIGSRSEHGAPERCLFRRRQAAP